VADSSDSSLQGTDPHPDEFAFAKAGFLESGNIIRNVLIFEDEDSSTLYAVAADGHNSGP
jgi:hypothetical protein